MSRNYYKDLASDARNDAKAIHVSLQNPNKSNNAYAAQNGSQVRAPSKLGTPSWESHSTAMSGSIFGGPLQYSLWYQNTSGEKSFLEGGLLREDDFQMGSVLRHWAVLKAQKS